MCFQELFYGPYFCQVQDAEYYSYTEPIPDGPTTKRFQSVAKELGMVLVLPMYEIVQAGQYFNTAAVIDADGTYLGKYRKQHIPQVKGFWEKFYFTPGTGGYPVFETAVGKVGVYICYDRHFPEGWRMLGLHGAEIVFNPSATHRGLSEYIWRLEQPAAAVANMYYVGAINRVGIEPLGDDDFYGQSYFVDPEGQFVGEIGDAYKPELIVRDLDLGQDPRGARPVGVLPRPPARRVRRHRRSLTPVRERGSMDIGVVLQTTPPSARVDRPREAGRERMGSATSGRSTLTSCGRSRSRSSRQILAHTRNVMVGPMVTNPLTRDWTVTASAVRHAERDVRQPDRDRDRPGRLRRPRDQRQAFDAGRAPRGVQVIRELANGRDGRVSRARRSDSRGRRRAGPRSGSRATARRRCS